MDQGCKALVQKQEFIIRGDKKKKKLKQQLSESHNENGYLTLKPLIHQINDRQDEGKKVKKKKAQEIFLPRTGIEQPFMKKRPVFIRETPEMEIMNFNNGLCKAQ